MTREHAPTRPVRHIAGTAAWALGVDWVVTRSLESSQFALSPEVEMVTGESLHWLKDAIAKPPSDCPCVPYDPDR